MSTMNRQFEIGWFRDPITGDVFHISCLGIGKDWLCTPYHAVGDRNPTGVGQILTTAQWKRLVPASPHLSGTVEAA